MRKSNVAKFIAKMDKLGDHWEPDEVKDIYGKTSLRKAVKTRKKEVKTFLRGFESLKKAGYDLSSINDPRVQKHFGKK